MADVNLPKKFQHLPDVRDFKNVLNNILTVHLPSSSYFFYIQVSKYINLQRIIRNCPNAACFVMKTRLYW